MGRYRGRDVEEVGSVSESLIIARLEGFKFSHGSRGEQDDQTDTCQTPLHGMDVLKVPPSEDPTASTSCIEVILLPHFHVFFLEAS